MAIFFPRGMRSAALAATVGCMAAAGARAADLAPPPGALPLPAAAPAPYSWTGVYGGLQAGHSWGDDKVTDLFTATGAKVGLFNAYKTKGFVGGIYGGADYQYESLVAGVAADLEASGLRGSYNDLPKGFDPGGIGKFHVAGQGSLRGRAGFAFDRFLVYATGGVAVANLKYSYFNPTNLLSENKSSQRAGWTAGGGIAYAWTGNIVVQAEYRYTNLGTFNYVSNIAYVGITARQQPRYGTLRAGVAYRF